MNRTKISSFKALIISLLAFILAFSVSSLFTGSFARAEDGSYTFKYDEEDDTVITGITIEGDEVSIEIPAKVTKIDDTAFVGKKAIKAVTFAEGSKLEEIGVAAFNGTGITTLNLPASLKVLGAGAFSECESLTYVIFEGGSVEIIGLSAFGKCSKLQYVILPDNADKIDFLYIEGDDGYTASDKGLTFNGTTVEGNQTYVIAKDWAQYAAVSAKFNVVYDDELEIKVGDQVLCGAKLGYPITIRYMREGIRLGDEVCLSANYAVKYVKRVNEGDAVTDDVYYWNDTQTDKIGSTNALQQIKWYYENRIISSVTRATEILTSAIGDTIIFDTFDDVDTKVFEAKTGLVYDSNKSYGMDQLNDLLTYYSDRVTKGMTTSIISYQSPNSSSPNTTNPPQVIHNAGTYVVKIVVIGGEDGETPDVDTDEKAEYTVEIVIAQQEVDLDDYAQLSWRVGGGTELGDMMPIYLYPKIGGGVFPSNTILSIDQINRLHLTSNYETDSVQYSVARSTGGSITVSLAANEAFTNVTYSGDKTKTDAGMYKVTATILANENYKLTTNNAVNTFRGMQIELTKTGANVTKTWYIVNVSNWLTTASGHDYSDMVGNTYAFGQVNIPIPQTKYGADASISIELYLGETRIGSFAPASFTTFINGSMPTGSYRMRITVGAVTVVSTDEKGESISERHEGFIETYAFTVEKSIITGLKDFNDAVSGKIFTYQWDEGTPHYFEQSAEAVAAWENFQKGFTSITRIGEWEKEKYDSYYGAPVIEYNLESEQSSYYYASVASGAASTYKIYYKVSAPNYYDTIESLAQNDSRLNYYFTVINVRSVSIPTIASKTFNGGKLTADVTLPVDVDGNSIYTVKENNGGTSANTYSVVLTLADPTHYMWEGQTISNKTADITVNFVIEKYRDNYFTTTLGITTWTHGKYDKIELAEGEFPLVVGARFGSVVITLTSTQNPDEVLYEGANGTEELGAILKGLKAGSYIVTAKVAGTDDFNDLSDFIIFQVFEKDGLPWWAVLIIVVGVLGLVALVLFILHQKGTLQLLFGKVVIAMRAKATVDATIAAVRASKVAAESRKSVAKAEALDRIEALRAAHKEERLKSADEQAATLEEKAQIAARSAVLMQKRTGDLLRRAEAIKQQNPPVLSWSTGANETTEAPNETHKDTPDDWDTEE